MFARYMFAPWCSPRGFRHGYHFGREWAEMRARRGDIKFLLLELLKERPRHGYDLIKELETRYAGFYRPSAGSIYPTLQMLEEGGYLTSEMVEGKRVYTITESGRKLLEERERSAGWGDSRATFRSAMRAQRGRLSELSRIALELGSAVMQVARYADEDRVTKAQEILERARREIYAILSEGK